jgi:hypothetical protein
MCKHNVFLHYVYYVCNMKNMPYVQGEIFMDLKIQVVVLCHDTIAFHRLQFFRKRGTCCLHLYGRYEDGVSRFLQTAGVPCEMVHGIKNLAHSTIHSLLPHASSSAVRVLCTTLLNTVVISYLKTDPS